MNKLDIIFDKSNQVSPKQEELFKNITNFFMENLHKVKWLHFAERILSNKFVLLNNLLI